MGSINRGYISGKLSNLKMHDFNGDKVAYFSVRQYWRAKDEAKTEHTDFFKMEARGNEAEWVEKIFKPGVFAVVEYKLRLRKNKETGFDEIYALVTSVDPQPKERAGESTAASEYSSEE